MALAQNLQIQSKNQGGTFGCFSALNEALDKASVFHHIKLKPKWFGGVLRHILNRANTHGGEAEGHTKLFSGLGCKDLAIGMLHAGQARWR